MASSLARRKTSSRKSNTRFRKTAESFTPGAKTLARKYFTSEETFSREVNRIFATQWICVGHQNQVGMEGDYFVEEIAGESLLIVRNHEAGIRAFYNVCRHRGTRLCEDEGGHLGRAIQCPYHAWTYGLDGRLIGAPHMEGVQGFEKSDYSLHSLALGLWEGFIFVSLAKRPLPLDRVFAPLAGKFTHWNLPALRSARRIIYEVKANWKLIFENYSECYH